MEMFLNTHRWRSMRALFMRSFSGREFSIYFKAKSIKYSVIKYVHYMMSLHGGKYAGFINAFGTQELEKITANRFNIAYVKSVREGDYDNMLSSLDLRDSNLKYGYFNEIYYYFDANPEIIELTENDLMIAGNQKVKIPRSSLTRRFTKYEDLESIIAANQKVL